LTQDRQKTTKTKQQQQQQKNINFVEKQCDHSLISKMDLSEMELSN